MHRETKEVNDNTWATQCSAVKPPTQVKKKKITLECVLYLVGIFDK